MTEIELFGEDADMRRNTWRNNTWRKERNLREGSERARSTRCRRRTKKHKKEHEPEEEPEAPETETEVQVQDLKDLSDEQLYRQSIINKYNLCVQEYQKRVREGGRDGN